MSRAMEVSSRASDSAGPSRTPSWVTGSRQQRRGGITRAASSSDVDVASTKGKILTLPTVLTILRVLAIPAVVACWVREQLAHDSFFARDFHILSIFLQFHATLQIVVLKII